MSKENSILMSWKHSIIQPRSSSLSTGGTCSRGRTDSNWCLCSGNITLSTVWVCVPVRCYWVYSDFCSLLLFKALKENYVVFRKGSLIRSERFLLTEQTKTNALCVLNKLTDLKGQPTVCLTFGGPRHLSGFTQSSVDLIFFWEQLVYSLMEKVNISEFVLSPLSCCKY